jgi:glycine/D-amino acid oxidase-like deaminating enzyme/nitrite reductase/ring-hydroxylating ferredoxin subunit
MRFDMTKHSNLDIGTLPYWADSASLPTFPKIARDIDVDVVVIGAGITGLTTAYLLLREGKSVAVIERGTCADVDTGHTTAHVTMVTDTRLSELVRRFGRPHAQAVWDAGLAAIDQIDRIVSEREIDCEFEWVDGYLHAPTWEQKAKQVATFKEEAELARELGFRAAFVENVPMVGGPGIRFADQARFHPRKYVAGLAHAVRSMGGEIFEHSGTEEFLVQPIRVKANGRRARCNDIVIATHNPLAGLAGSMTASVFQTKLALYTSYVIAGRVPRGTVPDALFWDTADPYHYLRIDPQLDHDLVIFGGEDHKTGQAPDTNACYARLEKALGAITPDIAQSYRWSGQVIETPDGIPYIGKMTDHQYAATGFAGNGMTFGTLAAVMFSDAINGRKNPWTDLFDPGRAAIQHGLWDYLKENADYPYYMMRARFADSGSRSLLSVKPGNGKIIHENGARIAAYRRPDGSLTLLSAACTHMGCTVAWNEAERSWDCPCHGSRFTSDGEVISGPAQTPLAPHV